MPDAPDDWRDLDVAAILDLLLGPPTIPPGDGASAAMPGPGWFEPPADDEWPSDPLFDDPASAN